MSTKSKTIYHKAQVKALIQKYGANKLSEVNPDDYEALLLDAEVI